MTRFEDVIQLLKHSSPFELARHMSDIVAGLEDLDRRVQALEAQSKPKDQPHA